MELKYKNFKLNDVVMDFINSIAVEKGSPLNTRMAYKNDLVQFLNWVIKQNLNYRKLKDIDVEAYLYSLSERSYATSTISRKTATLKTFFLLP